MTSPASLTGPINFGNRHEFTIAELAELIIQLTGSKSAIVHMPLPPDDPRQRQPDTTLAERDLDWRATTPLRDGLLTTIEYFDGLLREGV
jgi:UDP-glucuronate decarboxylase